jgi:hypothetical protein
LSKENDKNETGKNEEEKVDKIDENEIEIVTDEDELNEFIDKGENENEKDENSVEENEKGIEIENKNQSDGHDQGDPGRAATDDQSRNVSNPIRDLEIESPVPERGVITKSNVDFVDKGATTAVASTKNKTTKDGIKIRHKRNPKFIITKAYIKKLYDEAAREGKLLLKNVHKNRHQKPSHAERRQQIKDLLEAMNLKNDPNIAERKPTK